MSASNRFKDFLEKTKDDDEPRCWFCNKSENDIRGEYMEYMSQPENLDKEIELDDLIIMSHKTKKPVCAGCYFQIKNNKDMVDEIFERPEEDVWGLEEDQE